MRPRLRSGRPPAEARDAGWTLIELITVLALLAVIGAIAAPRMWTRGVFEARGYVAELVGAARLSRQAAVASGCPVRLSLSPGGFRAQQPAALGTHCDAANPRFTSPLILADGRTLDGVAPAGVAVVGNLQWTFLADGSVRVRGGRRLRVSTWVVEVDPVNGVVSGP